MAKKPRRHPKPFTPLDRVPRMPKPKREHRKKEQHAQYEEFMTCRTPGCKNVIAKWATGEASNGYCAACR